MRCPSLRARFAAETGGAVALIFALALVPLTFSVGAAIDYARAASARTDLQSATDATALAVGRAVMESNPPDMPGLARQVFDAGFQRRDGTGVIKFQVARNGTSLTVTAGARVPMAFAGILNRGGTDVQATAEVQLGATDLEVALVLDNTGSMSEAGKMTELKRAAKGLIDRLQAASTTNPNIKISIVPFSTLVKVPASNPPPIWLRPPPPSGDNNDEDAVWKGCITDRDQPYDTMRTLPTTGLLATLYVGVVESCPRLQLVMPLSKNFADLRAHVDGMQPNGNTNTTIGLAWGLNTLTPGAPMSGTAEAQRPNLRKHIVFLTDGENTENRWTRNSSRIDARTSLICDEIKKASITVHTIRLVEGNGTLLKRCASEASLYHSISSATDLAPIFEKVAKQIIALRIAR